MRCCLREVEKTSIKIRWNNRRKQNEEAIKWYVAKEYLRTCELNCNKSVESGNKGARIAGIAKAYGEVEKTSSSP